MKHILISNGQFLSDPRICILTGHQDVWLPLAKLTTYSNVAEYAMRWSHDMMVLSGNMPGVEYYPLLRLQEAVKLAESGKYDWIWVLGADLLITNMTIPLTKVIDSDFHLIISSDWNGWQADSFLLRCSPDGIRFISSVIFKFDEYANRPHKEQDAMFDLSPRHRNVCKLVPQRMLSAYNYDLYEDWAGISSIDLKGHSGQWQPGDFIIHWAGMNLPIRLEQAAKYIPQIVR